MAATGIASTGIASTGTGTASLRAATGGWRAVAEHWMRKYRRIWLGSAFSSFLTPLFFLGGIGFGLGMLVDRGTGGIMGVPYVAFVAPGVFAAIAMQIGAGECSYSVMGGIKWDRLYHGMLATPLRARDVVVGQLAFVLFRVVSATTVFLVIAALFGVVRSWWAVLAVGVASFAGLAFAACAFAFSATVEQDRGLTMMFRFVVTPMSLFAGTYFPLEQLPGWLQPVAWATPWWHAVDAVRGLFLGTATPGMVLGHLAYLTVWFVAGYLSAVAALNRRMVV